MPARLWASLALAVLLGTVLAACGGGGGGSSKAGGTEHALQGRLTVAGRCELADINEAGSPVTVKDQAGIVIASSSLGIGTTDTRNQDQAGQITDSAGTYHVLACEYPFSVQVPDRTFYTFEVGQHGAVTYSRTEVANDGWSVDLIINSSG